MPLSQDNNYTDYESSQHSISSQSEMSAPSAIYKTGLYQELTKIIYCPTFDAHPEHQDAMNAIVTHNKQKMFYHLFTTVSGLFASDLLQDSKAKEKFARAVDVFMQPVTDEKDRAHLNIYTRETAENEKDTHLVRRLQEVDASEFYDVLLQLRHIMLDRWFVPQDIGMYVRFSDVLLLLENGVSHYARQVATTGSVFGQYIASRINLTEVFSEESLGGYSLHSQNDLYVERNLEEIHDFFRLRQSELSYFVCAFLLFVKQHGKLPEFITNDEVSPTLEFTEEFRQQVERIAFPPQEVECETVLPNLIPSLYTRMICGVGQTPLLCAIMRGDAQTARHLIPRCLDENTHTDSLGRSAVQYAVVTKQEELLSALLCNGFAYHMLDSKGYAPIHYATEMEWGPGIKILLGYETAQLTLPSRIYHITPLHLAVKGALYGNLTILDILLSEADELFHFRTVVDNQLLSPLTILHLASASQNDHAIVALHCYYQKLRQHIESAYTSFLENVSFTEITEADTTATLPCIFIKPLGLEAVSYNSVMLSDRAHSVSDPYCATAVLHDVRVLLAWTLLEETIRELDASLTEQSVQQVLQMEVSKQYYIELGQAIYNLIVLLENKEVSIHALYIQVYQTLSEYQRQFPQLSLYFWLLVLSYVNEAETILEFFNSKIHPLTQILMHDTVKDIVALAENYPAMLHWEFTLGTEEVFNFKTAAIRSGNDLLRATSEEMQGQWTAAESAEWEVRAEYATAGQTLAQDSPTQFRKLLQMRMPVFTGNPVKHYMTLWASKLIFLAPDYNNIYQLFHRGNCVETIFDLLRSNQLFSLSRPEQISQLFGTYAVHWSKDPLFLGSYTFNVAGKITTIHFPELLKTPLFTENEVLTGALPDVLTHIVLTIMNRFKEILIQHGNSVEQIDNYFNQVITQNPEALAQWLSLILVECAILPASSSLLTTEHAEQHQAWFKTQGEQVQCHLESIATEHNWEVVGLKNPAKPIANHIQRSYSALMRKAISAKCDTALKALLPWLHLDNKVELLHWVVKRLVHATTIERNSIVQVLMQLLSPEQYRDRAQVMFFTPGYSFHDDDAVNIFIDFTKSEATIVDALLVMSLFLPVETSYFIYSRYQNFLQPLLPRLLNLGLYEHAALLDGALTPCYQEISALIKTATKEEFLQQLDSLLQQYSNVSNLLQFTYARLIIYVRFDLLEMLITAYQQKGMTLVWQQSDYITPLHLAAFRVNVESVPVEFIRAHQQFATVKAPFDLKRPLDYAVQHNTALTTELLQCTPLNAKDFSLLNSMSDMETATLLLNRLRLQLGAQRFHRSFIGYLAKGNEAKRTKNQLAAYVSSLDKMELGNFIRYLGTITFTQANHFVYRCVGRQVKKNHPDLTPEKLAMMGDTFVKMMVEQRFTEMPLFVGTLQKMFKANEIKQFVARYVDTTLSTIITSILNNANLNWSDTQLHTLTNQVSEKDFLLLHGLFSNNGSVETLTRRKLEVLFDLLLLEVFKQGVNPPCKMQEYFIVKLHYPKAQIAEILIKGLDEQMQRLCLSERLTLDAAQKMQTNLLQYIDRLLAEEFTDDKFKEGYGQRSIPEPHVQTITNALMDVFLRQTSHQAPLHFNNLFYLKLIQCLPISALFGRHESGWCLVEVIPASMYRVLSQETAFIEMVQQKNAGLSSRAMSAFMLNLPVGEMDHAAGTLKELSDSRAYDANEIAHGLITQPLHYEMVLVYDEEKDLFMYMADTLNHHHILLIPKIDANVAVLLADAPLQQLASGLQSLAASLIPTNLSNVVIRVLTQHQLQQHAALLVGFQILLLPTFFGQNGYAKNGNLVLFRESELINVKQELQQGKKQLSAITFSIPAHSQLTASLSATRELIVFCVAPSAQTLLHFIQGGTEHNYSFAPMLIWRIKLATAANMKRVYEYYHNTPQAMGRKNLAAIRLGTAQFNSKNDIQSLLISGGYDLVLYRFVIQKHFPDGNLDLIVALQNRFVLTRAQQITLFTDAIQYQNFTFAVALLHFAMMTPQPCEGLITAVKETLNILIEQDSVTEETQTLLQQALQQLEAHHEAQLVKISPTALSNLVTLNPRKRVSMEEAEIVIDDEAYLKRTADVDEIDELEVDRALKKLKPTESSPKVNVSLADSLPLATMLSSPATNPHRLYTSPRVQRSPLRGTTPGGSPKLMPQSSNSSIEEPTGSAPRPAAARRLF